MELSLIVGLLFYLSVSEALPDVPLCPSHYFGYRCPTCGTTRSVWCILHGDFGTAWDFNPIGYVVLLVLGRRIVVLSASNRGLNELLENKWVNLTLLSAFLTFVFLRMAAVF